MGDGSPFVLIIFLCRGNTVKPRVSFLAACSIVGSRCCAVALGRARFPYRLLPGAFVYLLVPKAVQLLFGRARFPYRLLPGAFVYRIFDEPLYSDAEQNLAIT